MKPKHSNQEKRWREFRKLIEPEIAKARPIDVFYDSRSIARRNPGAGRRRKCDEEEEP